MLEIKNWVEADQSTGRIIHVPNGLVFTHPIMNYNQAMEHIWNEVPVTVTFESDWRKAKEILLEIGTKSIQPRVKDVEIEMSKANRKYFVKYDHLAPTVYTKIKANGVLLTLRFLCSPRRRRSEEQLVYEEILTRFAQHRDIQFAYPTTRFYRSGEGALPGRE